MGLVTESYIVAFVVGLLLGGIHFGGLWMTVQRMPAVKRPVFLAVMSAVARLVFLCMGLWVVSSWSGPQGLLLALVGVLCARTIYLYKVGVQAVERAGERRGGSSDGGAE